MTGVQTCALPIFLFLGAWGTVAAFLRGAPFVSTAKLALGQILYSQGKVDEGRKLIQEVIDSPTEFVSSEHASLALARLLLKDKPEEARKLLDALAKSRSAVSTVAVELSAQLPRVN